MAVRSEQPENSSDHGGDTLRPLSLDIHCHCLPGLDDGPEDMAGALALCRALVADGCGAVVATPHQLGRYDGRNSPKTVREAVRLLQGRLDGAGIPLQVFSGADVRIDERLVSLLRADEVSTVGEGGRYLLLELPHEVYVDPRKLVEQLHQAGFGVVVTHPERHGYLQSRTEVVSELVAMGAVMQVTAGSLVGEFGKAAEAAAWKWINDGLIAVVATDAHDVSRRPPRMSAAFEAVASRHNRQLALTMIVENPVAILAGDVVAELPDRAPEVTAAMGQVVRESEVTEDSRTRLCGVLAH